eukprot:6471521-Amphidinium_carterae.4
MFLLATSLVEAGVEWAAYTTKRGIGGSQVKTPVESACKSCGTVAARAYPRMTWESLLSKAKQSSSFAHELRLAQGVLRGEARPTFVPEQVAKVQTAKLATERSYLFWSVEEAEHELQAKVSTVPSLEALLVEITDELGRPARGFLLPDPANPLRRVRLSCGSDMQLSQQMMASKD